MMGQSERSCSTCNFCQLPTRWEGLRLRAMRLVIFCLLASGLSPSMTQAQAPAEVPIIKITKEDSSIKFHATKIVQTGPNTLDYVGDFTIRGVTKPEKLTFTLSGKGTGSGEIKGTMAFDRKDYGMTKGIPLVKIADRVEVIVDLKGKRVSGPPLVFKQ